MPTLDKHIIGVAKAHKDISGVLNELEHNGFMVDLEGPHAFERDDTKFGNFEGMYRCIECGLVDKKDKFAKIFQRGEGICNRDWMHEE